MAMKIVIEGMDGVGKSTVAREVANRLGAKYVDGFLINYLTEQGMSIEETKIIHKAIDICTDNENSIVRTWLYAFANLFNLVHYDCDLIIDRHCLTTFYYNGDDDSKDIYKYMQKYMGKPDLVIILRATEATRRSRICKRDINDPDLLSDVKMNYGYDQMEEAAKFLELDYKVIDTDNKNLNEVIDETMAMINNWR